MSNYVKLTDYAAKDALTTGNPLKLIKGTEINDDLNAIQTAVATKADVSSPDFLGNPTAPTQVFGNSTTRLATTAFVQAALQALHPIGSIYIAVISTNPGTLFGFGTWVAFATGRTLIGINPADTIMDTAEETGGSKDAVIPLHTHTVTDPGHFHIDGYGGTDAPAPRYGLSNTAISARSDPDTTTGLSYVTGANTSTEESDITIAETGVSVTNANLPPYVVVYMWKRTA